MSEPIWIYKWIDADGTHHITTSYIEANNALHSPSHPMVYGSRYREPQSVNPLDDDEELIY